MISLVSRSDRAELRRHAPAPEVVIEAVASFWNINADEVRGTSRRLHITLPRQVAMWLLYQRCGHSFESVGEIFARDHTTVVHACQAVARMTKVDERLKSQIDHLERVVGVA